MEFHDKRYLVSSAGMLLVLACARSSTANELVPRPEAAHTEPRGNKVRFVADPITDGAILSISVGFAALLDVIIDTGELRPQQPGPTDQLLSIDRDVVRQKPSEDAKTVSNVGVGAAGVYAFGSAVFTGFTEGQEAALVDLIIYGESASITWALTNLTKLAVRRPRPTAYRLRDERQAQNLPPSELEITGTNAALSFFSGHASMAAALSTTATYLAFSRSETPTRGFITGAAGALVTTAVCWGRVRGGVHFPTDVIAGAMAGIGVGALVPHFHREEESKPVWIGFGPQGEDGFGLSLYGRL
jgi:undecaprenyl-diphosphatase